MTFEEILYTLLAISYFAALIYLSIGGYWLARYIIDKKNDRKGGNYE